MLKRVLVAVGVLAAVGLGCWRNAQAPARPRLLEGIGFEGVVLPDGGGQCRWEMIPLTSGRCLVDLDRYERDPSYAAPTASRWFVPCGAPADVCGAQVPCDCTHPVDEAPCGDAGLESFRAVHRFDGGEPCTVRLLPPHLGYCYARVSYGRSDGFAIIPFNQTRTICHGHLDQHCGCGDFNPVGTPPRCTFNVLPEHNGRCAVKYQSCTSEGCEDLETWVALGESDLICERRIFCLPEPAFGADAGR